jgi:hypothetical protein
MEFVPICPKNRREHPLRFATICAKTKRPEFWAASALGTFNSTVQRAQALLNTQLSWQN